jgi:predicted DsbA family dithiol-disulfide isomerase
MTLEELFVGRNIDLPAAQERMTGLMREEGLPYGIRTHTYNSRSAQELAAWAVTQPGGAGIHDALFLAYFVDGRNIAERNVLLDVVVSIGLSTSDAEQVLESRSHRDLVDADWAESRQLGITGVPTFVVGNQGVAGAQPFEVLEQLAIQAGATRSE